MMEGKAFMEAVLENNKEARLVLVCWRTYHPSPKILEKQRALLEQDPTNVLTGEVMVGPKTWLMFNPAKAEKTQLEKAFRGLDSQSWRVEVVK